MNKLFKNFSDIFSLVLTNFSANFIKTLIDFHFLKLATNFSQNQGKLYVQSTGILLITEISRNCLKLVFLKLTLNFSRNFLNVF